MITTNSIWQSKHLSDTTGQPHYIRIILPEVEWVDNINCSKNRTSYPVEVIGQRCKLVHDTFVDDATVPLAMFQEQFLENYTLIKP